MQVRGVLIADRLEQSVCFCVTKRVVSFILNLECPLKSIVLLDEICSRMSRAFRRSRNLELLRRIS